MSNKNYIEQCLAGDLLCDEIDDFVADWHNTANANCSLREYLGFTADEYKLWAEQPDLLSRIIDARKHKIPLEEVIDEMAMATKSEFHSEAK